MYSGFKNIAAALTVTILITGCSTSGVSTHSNSLDHNGREWTHSYERGERRIPGSDHVSRRGDKSRNLVVAGQEHFRSQNYGLAEENFRKAVEMRSDNPTAWLGLAASLDQLGRFDFADRAYSQVTQLKPNDARVLNNIGFSYLLRGDYQKSRNYLNRAQTLDPSLEEVEGNIHLLEKVMSS